MFIYYALLYEVEDVKIQKTVFVILVLVMILSLGSNAVSATDSNEFDTMELDDSISDSISSDLDDGSISDSINSDNLDDSSFESDKLGDGSYSNDNALKDDSNTIYVSSEGDDENDGSQSNPVATISKAVSLADEGYTIHISAGTYDQNKSTQLSHALTFVGDDGAIIRRIGTANALTYTSDNIKTICFKNIIFSSTTANPNNPILSMAGRANLIINNCTFTDAIAGKGGHVRFMGSSTGLINNTKFINLTGSTSSASSYIQCLGESVVRVNNCLFANCSETMLRAVVYVNNNLSNVSVNNCNFINISGNLNAVFENRGYGAIANSTFRDISLRGNGPRGIIWSSETISSGSKTYINSSIFYNNSVDTEVVVNSAVIQAKSPTVVENSVFLYNDVDFVINNDNETSIIANYNWWGTNQDPKNCTITVYDDSTGEETSTNISLVSKGVTVDNWAIMTADFDTSGLIANENYPVIININQYMNEDGEINSFDGYGIGNVEILLDSIIGELNANPIIYTEEGSNKAKVYTKNGTITVLYKALEEGSDVLKIKSGYEEIIFNLEIAKAISYTDIYVSKSGNDINDGLSNSTAVFTIERALEIAKEINSNVRIHIGSGTYKESGFELNGTYTEDELAKRTIYAFIGYGNVVIDGNGADKSIFSIRNNSASFTNIRFTNVNGPARGGAILVRINDNGYLYEPNSRINADLTINKCTFDNINVTSSGGAIYYEYGSGRIDINNTKFYNLSAQSSQGGAIYVHESANLAKLKITGSDFRDNFANNAGAMYLRVSNITIKDTNFINNSAANYPGAIGFYNASAYIENCIIANSSAKKDSAAIKIEEGSNDEGNMITVKSCIIENNTARDELAPAIYVAKGVLNISYSSIVNDLSIATRTYNSSSSGLVQGVAIANNNWWGVNNPFGDNEIGGDYLYDSGAVINGSNITIDSWVILYVEMNDTGVLKVGNKVNISIDFAHVNTTSGEIKDLSGGRIPKEFTLRLNSTGGNAYPNYMKITNGKANTIFTVVDDQGLGDNFTFSALDIKTDNEIYHIIFEINNYKGVIFVSVDGDDDRNGSKDAPVRTIEKAIQLALDEDFGSHEIIVLPGTYDVCGIDIDYTYLIITGSGINQTIFDGDGFTGGMFSIFEGDLTIKNLSIMNGVNTISSGGAFTNMGNLTLDKVYVTNCQVKNVNGGVIYSVGNLNLINSSFVENTALSGNYASGGVIYTDGYYSSLSYPPSLNITDCEFISNSAKSSTFGGGAIYMQYVDGFKSIKNTKFINNQAMYGGAIFMQNSMGDFVMDNVSFIGNKATGSSSTSPSYGGGALNLIGKTDGRVGNITITNSLFENNTARNTRGGGAILDRNVDLNISNSAIINNKDSDKNIQIYKDTTVYFPSGGKIVLEDNWWGANDLSQLSTIASNASIERWVLMDLAVDEIKNSSSNLFEYLVKVSLDKYNDGSLIKDNPNHDIYYPFERIFKLSSSNGSFNPQSAVLIDNIGESVYSSNSKSNIITATIDNQSLEFDTSKLINASLSLVVDDIVVGESSNIKVFLFDKDNVPISITVNVNVNGKDYSVEVIDGKGSVDIDPINEINTYLVVASYDDEIYGSKSCESNLTVYGPGNATVKHTDAGDAADIQAAIDAANPGDILRLGDYDYTEVSDVNITKDLAIVGGEATRISSAGNGKPIFNIPAKSENGPDSVNITGIEFKVKNGDVIVKAIADNDTRNPLSIDTQAISITDNIIEVMDESVVPESVTVLKLESERPVLAPTNDIAITGNTIDAGINPFDFDVTSVSSGSDVSIPVGPISKERIETEIIYENMTTTAVDVDTDGRVGEYFYITLKDKDNNLLANKPVQIGFNGQVYDRTTDENGQARLQINLKNAGTYTFAVSYLGDDDYNGSFIVAKIVVNKQKGSLTVPSKTYKASAASKTLTATFKSASGKVVANKKITFTVDGKSYSATTNDKGLATVKVSLSKKGTYSFNVKFAGNTMYAAVNKIGKLVIN